MLKKLNIKNFTVFTDVQFEFSKGLNIVIGDNATGKSFMLKLGYSVMYVLSRQNSTINATKTLANKLYNVFKPNSLGHLNRNGSGRQRTQIRVEIELSDSRTELLQFSFAKNSRSKVTLDQITTNTISAPLFFPTREVLTLHPEIIALYEERYLSLDETHYDLCKALSLPLLKQPPNDLKKIIESLEAELGGKITVDKTGHFYLDIPKQGQVEISLIAEGYRKIAMLIYLILNGSLSKGSTLFWDETEANLNARIMVKVANALVALAQHGIQVILATHDFFLMKELSLLIESTPNLPARFFSLRMDNAGVAVEEGRILEDLNTIVVLDEVLAQDDREQDFYYKSGQ
ncbi:AAA family ATPase [Candidatus Marithioploca araucensis]|jgi:AAA15 family ATPase/GTPase|uniref:AAA family ATPase n=1 Tax=Candidatus Marithioploca araucensis TaxID=70273 RepID=A0ABT7VQ24_9GAMM|nr:AAA family ATPase [Candidatus Marithioploca araucensis]